MSSSRLIKSYTWSHSTKKGHCGTCRKKHGLADNKMCDCCDIQTMSHIVDSCLLTKLNWRSSTSTHCWLADVTTAHVSIRNKRLLWYDTITLVSQRYIVMLRDTIPLTQVIR